MDVIILAFKLSVITRKMFNFSEMCLFDGHKSLATSNTAESPPLMESRAFAWSTKRKRKRRRSSFHSPSISLINFKQLDTQQRSSSSIRGSLLLDYFILHPPQEPGAHRVLRGL